MMKKIIQSVDRWGPAVVSVITLFLFAATSWWYSERIARLEGHIQSLQSQVNIHMQSEQSLRIELSGIKNWMIAVYERGSANNWNLPIIPIEKGKGVIK